MLVFNIREKGKIEIAKTDFLEEWYLVDKDDWAHKDRKYVDADWFYDQLKNDEEGIYQFCSQVDYKTNSPEIERQIKKYINKFRKETENYGMDGTIYMMEVYMQEATKEPNLHWW